MANVFGLLGQILWVLAAPAAAIAGEGTTCLLQSSVGMRLSHESHSRYQPSSDYEPSGGLLFQPASASQFAAALEAENKAIAYFHSLLEAELNFTRPMRLAKKKLKLANVKLARDPLKKKNQTHMRKQDTRSAQEAVGEAMKVIVEAGKRARGNLSRGDKNGTKYEATITAFVLDGVMGLTALFMPTGTCMLPMILMWWVLGVLALHYDQGMSLADAILMLTQMATTVGYGTQTPTTPLMRAFHSFHGWLVGQGIDTAMDTMADMPLDYWDDKVMKRFLEFWDSKVMSKIFKTLRPGLRQDLRHSITTKFFDLLMNMIVTTTYFAFDFKQGWKNEDGTQMFKDLPATIGPALYTTIISMTSIGYGDFYPKTQWGKTTSAAALSMLTHTFERYSDALGEWNDLGKFREHKEPDPGFPQDQPAWHFGNCPLFITEGDPNWIRRFFLNKEDYMPVSQSIQASPEMVDTAVGTGTDMDDEETNTLSSSDLDESLPPLIDDELSDDDVPEILSSVDDDDLQPANDDDADDTKPVGDDDDADDDPPPVLARQEAVVDVDDDTFKDQIDEITDGEINDENPSEAAAVLEGLIE